MLLLTLALALGGCPGSIMGMVKQSEILGFYSGGPGGGWNKEDDYKDCNMRVGTTGSRLFSADPPATVHDCMKEKGYAVSLPTQRSGTAPSALARPAAPRPEPTWDTGL